MTGASRIFQNPNFRRLFTGKIISQLGDQFYIFCLGWYILDLTRSSLQMASFIMTETLVFALVTPLGGIIADRCSRQNILVWTDLVRGFVVLAVAALISAHQLELWMLYPSALILGCCAGLFVPAASAIIPDIVTGDQLVQASSLDNFIGSCCAAVGILGSGILYNLLGIFGVFVLNGSSYLGSAWLESRLALPLREHRTKCPESSANKSIKRFVAEIAAGYRYILTNRLILSLTAFNALFNFIAIPALFILLPFIFNTQLQASPFQLALVQGSAWVGILLSSLVAPRFLKKIKLQKAIFGALCVYCLCQAINAALLLAPTQSVLSLWQTTGLFSCNGLLIGLAMPFIFIPLNVLFQANTAEAFRGQFWGLQSSLLTIALPLGYLLIGWSASQVPASLILLGIAMLMMAANLVVNRFGQSD